MGCGASSTAKKKSNHHATADDASDSDEAVNATFDSVDVSAFQAAHSARVQQDAAQRRQDEARAAREQHARDKQQREREAAQHRDWEEFEVEQRRLNTTIASEARNKHEGTADVLTL
jgi:hypothetical protein